MVEGEIKVGDRFEAADHLEDPCVFEVEAVEGPDVFRVVDHRGHTMLFTGAFVRSHANRVDLPLAEHPDAARTPGIEGEVAVGDRLARTCSGEATRVGEVVEVSRHMAFVRFSDGKVWYPWLWRLRSRGTRWRRAAEGESVTDSAGNVSAEGGAS